MVTEYFNTTPKDKQTSPRNGALDCDIDGMNKTFAFSAQFKEKSIDIN